MHELLRHHETLPPTERRTMSPQTSDYIGRWIDQLPLDDPDKLTALTQRMGDPDRMDGWLAAKEIADSLGDAYDLYWGDLGLLRVCLGNEHATAVFDGNEIDYIPLLDGNADILKISRLTALLQDSGKVLSVARTGSNFAQTQYNAMVAQKIVNSIPDNHLRPAAKRAVVALVELDVIGGLLQGHDIDEKLMRFLQAWPSEFNDYRDDLMLSSYLSDASAHSEYRLYRNARNGFVEPAVREDDAQLSFLFERHPGGAITLTPDRRQLLLDFLPNAKRLRHLLTGETSPYPRDDQVFAQTVTRLARQSEDGVFRRRVQHSYGTDAIILEEHGILGVSANILTYPSGTYNKAIDRRYWLPGDGQVWLRSVWVGNITPGEPSPFPQEYTHDDPAIAAMQYKVAMADRAYDSVVGMPLSPQKTWHIIHYLENLR